MKQQYHSRLRRLLALGLCCSLLQPAWGTVTVTGGGTSADDPRVTVTVTEHPKTGGTESVHETLTEWDTRTDEGFGTVYREQQSATTLTDSAGEVLQQTEVTEGSEITTETKTPAVTVPLEEGKETSASSALQGGTEGVTKSENPKEYDETTVTVEQQRTVHAVTGLPQITSGSDTAEDTLLTPMQPVWTGEEQDITAARPDRFGQSSETPPAGYAFRYTGWGQDSHYGATHITTHTVTDENGDPIVTERQKESDILHFLLTDASHPEAPDHVTYCADICTDVQNGWWYRMENLEDADYYSDEDAAHIRAIAANGYWGTAAGETGSLSVMQTMLEDARQNGSDETRALLQGFDFTQLTAGEAQAATQMAIWQYGHRYGDADDLRLTASNFNGSYGWQTEEGDEEAWARINAAAAYLMGLTASAEESDTLITEKTFLESMALTVKEEVPTEDATAHYCADLSFVLVVTPGEQDQLLVQVLQNGSVVGGCEILPGEREYTIPDLVLAEGQDVTFDLTMTGVQHLEQGVYLYTSEVQGDESSQTFVGLAEGERAVELTMQMTLCFTAEDAVVTTEHLWRSEQCSAPAPLPDPILPEEVPNPPMGAVI